MHVVGYGLVKASLICQAFSLNAWQGFVLSVEDKFCECSANVCERAPMRRNDCVCVWVCVCVGGFGCPSLGAAVEVVGSKLRGNGGHDKMLLMFIVCICT